MSMYSTCWSMLIDALYTGISTLLAPMGVLRYVPSTYEVAFTLMGSTRSIHARLQMHSVLSVLLFPNPRKGVSQIRWGTEAGSRLTLVVLFALACSCARRPHGDSP